jgi:hypothetical protein
LCRRLLDVVFLGHDVREAHLEFRLVGASPREQRVERHGRSRLCANDDRRGERIEEQPHL